MSHNKSKNYFSRHGESPSGSSVLLTLPIACQICLGKVKEPTVCPNQHVFCYSCLNEWLKSCKMCPACRIPITENQHCKRIIGSIDVEPTQDETTSFRSQMRRTRMAVLLQEYENDSNKMEIDMEKLVSENLVLKKQIETLQRSLQSSEERLIQMIGIFHNLKQHNDSNKMEIDMEKLVSENLVLKKQIETLQRSLQSSEERLIQMIGDDSNNTVSSSSRNMPNDLNTVLLLSSKLQDMVHKKEELENEIQLLRQEVKSGQLERARLTQEIGFIREEAVQSPKKHNRYTVLALQTKLDTYEREIHKLKRALERSDEYTEYLQNQLNGSHKNNTIELNNDDLVVSGNDVSTPSHDEHIQHNGSIYRNIEESEEMHQPTIQLLMHTNPNDNDERCQSTRHSSIPRNIENVSQLASSSTSIQNCKAMDGKDGHAHRSEQFGTVNDRSNRNESHSSPVSGAFSTSQGSASNQSTPEYNIPRHSNNEDPAASDRYDNPTLYPACAKLIQLTRAHQSTNQRSPLNDNNPLSLADERLQSNTAETPLPKIVSSRTATGQTPPKLSPSDNQQSPSGIVGTSPNGVRSSPLKESRSPQRVEICTPPSLKRIKAEPVS